MLFKSGTKSSDKIPRTTILSIQIKKESIIMPINCNNTKGHQCSVKDLCRQGSTRQTQ